MSPDRIGRLMEMAARDKERYFWVKLRRDFFKRHDIRILEKQQNGKELVLLFLKLMAESVDHEGALRFSEALPYSEEMLACVTDTDSEIVHLGLRAFQELGMLELKEDGTICIPVVAKLLDSETAAAQRKREYRTEKREEGDNVPLPSPGCLREKESELQPESNPELYSQRETDDCTAPAGAACRPEDVRRVVQAWNSLGLQQLSRVTAVSRRGSMLRARILEYGVDDVLEAIEKIRSSAFLRGQNAKGWVITFEWFVRPNNFPKVLEGNYEPYHNPSEKETANPFLAMLMEESRDKS